MGWEIRPALTEWLIQGWGGFAEAEDVAAGIFDIEIEACPRLDRGFQVLLQVQMTAGR